MIKGTYQDEESLEDIKKLPGTSLVTGLNSLADNLDHGGEKGLEGFLEKILGTLSDGQTLLTSSTLSSESMY